MYATVSHSRVLVLRESGQAARCATSLLRDLGCEVTLVGAARDAAAAVKGTTFDLIVVDSDQWQAGADKLVAFLVRQVPATAAMVINTGQLHRPPEPHPLIEIIATDTESLDLQATVLRLVDLARLKRETVTLKQTIAMSYGYDNLVGISKPMRQFRESLERVAPTDITLLLEGPPGTGKELAARVVHQHSPRRRQPFVMIDFSALPETSLKQHLFAGFNEGQPGMLRAADGGTLFLDAVDQVPQPLQAALAEFLQTMRPDDGDKLNVRLISATDQDLRRLVHSGQFDKLLYQLLNVIPLTLPSLTVRREDIEILTDYFLRHLAAENNLPSYAISHGAIERLQHHHWPGNVRELENCLRRAVALCQNRELEAHQISFIGESTPPPGVAISSKAPANGLPGRLDDNQRDLIVRALRANDWNYTQTAQELGIGRTTLWRKVKKYQLEKDKALC